METREVLYKFRKLPLIETYVGNLHNGNVQLVIKSTLCRKSILIPKTYFRTHLYLNLRSEAIRIEMSPAPPLLCYNPPPPAHFKIPLLTCHFEQMFFSKTLTRREQLFLNKIRKVNWAFRFFFFIFTSSFFFCFWKGFYLLLYFNFCRVTAPNSLRV